MNQKYKNRREFVGHAWRLIYPYWLSGEALVAWVLLLTIIGLNLGLVYLTVLLNDWSGKFYNAIQQKNYDDFIHLLYPHTTSAMLTTFCGLAFVYIVGAVYRLYLQQMLEIRWRNWLTREYLSEWLAGKRFYLLQLKDFGSDNPDQRIAEDLRILASLSLSLMLGLLSSVTTLVSFFMILWTLSGPISFELFGSAITVPGYMVWVAIVYAFIGSLLTHYIGRALIRLNFNQQRYEADFRFSLIRVREHGEAISLLNGEKEEYRLLGNKFSEIVANWWSIMRYQKRLTWFTAAYSQIASIFPLVVAAPRYFRGMIELGALMQISSAFGRVQDSLSWFIESYRALTEWKASVDRLVGFKNACRDADAVLEESSAALKRTMGNEIAGEVSLMLPNGEGLQSNIKIDIKPGEHVHVSGKSGRGKSTLFRALSGLWPFASGVVTMPENGVLFLPQKAYLPIATLREVLLYPGGTPVVPDEKLKSLLSRVGLHKLGDELEVTCDWSKRLSLGEQQRVVFLRAVLKDPKWLFMDEATASLDLGSQTELQEILDQELPATACISITHSATGSYDKVIQFSSENT